MALKSKAKFPCSHSAHGSLTVRFTVRGLPSLKRHPWCGHRHSE